MNELFPEPSHEGEAGMVVTVAIKSMSDAPKAAGPFGRSRRPAAALKTSVPTICQNKLLPARLGKLHHPSLPTPHRWAVVHVGSVFLAPHGSTASSGDGSPAPAEVLWWPPAHAQHCCGKRVLTQHLDAAPTLPS